MLKCIVCGNKGLVATISKINDKDQEKGNVIRSLNLMEKMETVGKNQARHPDMFFLNAAYSLGP
jgi:hypothetical protein